MSMSPKETTETWILAANRDELVAMLMYLTTESLDAGILAYKFAKAHEQVRNELPTPDTRCGVCGVTEAQHKTTVQGASHAWQWLRVGGIPT